MTAKPKYILSVRVGVYGRKPLADIWIMQQHTVGRECRLYGAMTPDAAEAIVALFAAAGVPIERDEPAPGTDALVSLPHGTVAATISATAKQGQLFPAT